MNGIDNLNYSPVPNCFIENMKDFNYATIAVFLAICRKTLGWHKMSDCISFTQLQEMTGLSRQGVSNAIKELKNHNLITVTKNKKTNQYDLNIKEIVNSVNQSTLSSVYSVDQNSLLSRPTSVYSVDTQKKERNSTKEKNNENYILIENKYFELFKDKYGNEPDYVYGRDRKVLKRYLQKHSAEEIIELLRIWFDNDIGAWHGYSITGLQKDWNKIQIARADENKEDNLYHTGRYMVDGKI